MKLLIAILLLITIACTSNSITTIIRPDREKAIERAILEREILWEHQVLSYQLAGMSRIQAVEKVDVTLLKHWQKYQNYHNGALEENGMSLVFSRARLTYLVLEQKFK